MIHHMLRRPITQRASSATLVRRRCSLPRRMDSHNYLLVRRPQQQPSCYCCFSSSAAQPNDTRLTTTTPEDKDEKQQQNLPSIPIDFSVAVKIEGKESQVATIALRPGETLRSEAGAMLYMTDGVVMDTQLDGVSSAVRRMMTGQNMFLTDYRYAKDTGTGTVCLGTAFPSKILRFSLDQFPDQTLICEQGAFLAASSREGVALDMEFTKSFTAGFFGGQGFVLQRLSGSGDVLIQGGGTLVRRDLAAGETLRVTSGSLVAFTASVQYEVQMMPGIQNALFGGEGLFVTTLTGPGQVWLQGMPPDRMIAEIARRVPAGSSGLGVPIILGGGGGSEGAAEGAAGAAAAGGTDVAAGGAAESSEAVAAADAAIEADRNATVATSSGLPSSSGNDVDSESSAALFGDAAPASAPEPAGVTPSAPPVDSNSTWGDDEPSFDDSTSFSTTESQEPSFDDSSSSSFGDDFSGGGEAADGEIFNDAASQVADSAQDASSGVMQTLWDMFMGND